MYRDFQPDELAKQYSPSSCIDDINVYIQAYIDESKANKSVALQKQLIRNDLNYLNHKDTTLDLFMPMSANKQNSHEKKELHIYIHGGYWQELTKEESCFAANNFQDHDHYFAVINYSLAPNASLSEIVEQNRQAITWLHNNANLFGYAAHDFVISGSSAGGHLAMMMALTDWSNYLSHPPKTLIKRVVAVSGIYDLRPIKDTYINEPLQLTQDQILQNSPLLFDINPPENCKFVIAYGENETSEFKRQSTEMATKLSQLSDKIVCQQINGKNHFDVILTLSEPTSWLFQQCLT
ncbi:alpha/beta hydrolase [Thalassotalea ganghwensis]